MDQRVIVHRLAQVLWDRGVTGEEEGRHDGYRPVRVALLAAAICHSCGGLRLDSKARVSALFSAPRWAGPSCTPPNQTEYLQLGNVLCRGSTCPVVRLTMDVSFSVGLPHRAVSLGVYPWILLDLWVVGRSSCRESNGSSISQDLDLYACRRTSKATILSFQDQPLLADSPHEKTDKTGNATCFDVYEAGGPALTRPADFLGGVGKTRCVVWGVQ